MCINLPEKAKSTEVVSLRIRYASVDASFGSARQLTNPWLEAIKTEQLCAENATPKNALIKRHKNKTFR